ncbi:dihydropyrimidinase [candidate division BRC1 bacterium HGW-BRC1-1]|nr:MAG: dihydropyrimidinase [candidate division BRC1 bacterium HGW-BRC1-1]
MSILIRNGRIVTATDDYIADLYAEDETISLIGRDLKVKADREFDATGRLVIPGGVDPHVHLDLPVAPGVVSSDDFETGTRAAAFGGTTCVIDFPTQDRGGSMLDALATWHDKAAGRACIDYGFHMIVTDLPESRLPEMDRLVQDEGVSTFKLFTAYPDRLYVDDAVLYRAMRRAGQLGAMVMMHAENGIVIDEIIREALRNGHTGPGWHGRTRPVEMEAEGVYRSIAIARVAEAAVYIVHLSCAAALEEVRRARETGQNVYAETCPQYLFLDDSRYDAPDFEAAKWVMTPALRPVANQQALWHGLRLNHLQAIATDHCPFCFADQKHAGRDNFTKIPNGAPGIENRMSLVYNGGVVAGRIDVNRFVELTSTAAAKLFGLFPRKGTIAVGSDADLVIFDPERRETISVNNPLMHHMRVDYSAYEGMEVQGYPETVISRGRVLCHAGQWHGESGAGRFLKRAPLGAQRS